MSQLYFSIPFRACFDGDGPATPPADSPPTSPPTSPPSTPPSPPPKLFTQAEVNQLMEGHRKGLQKQVEELGQQLEAAKGQGNDALLAKINDMSLSLKTTQEQAAEREKRLAAEKDSKIADQDKAYTKLSSEFQQYRIQHTLKDAALSGEAFNPDHIVTQLRGMTGINDAGEVQVKGLFQTEDGHPSLQTPVEAVKWMKEHPEQWGNFFKGAKPGFGLDPLPGTAPGKINPRKLTPEQYQKIRKENPGALGFDKSY